MGMAPVATVLEEFLSFDVDKILQGAQGTLCAYKTFTEIVNDAKEFGKSFRRNFSEGIKNTLNNKPSLVSGYEKYEFSGYEQLEIAITNPQNNREWDKDKKRQQRRQT